MTAPRFPVWWAVALLAIATMGAYFNSLSAPFIYDDVLAIAENPTIRQLWPLSEVLWPNVPGGVTVSGRPVLNLSLALNYAISGGAVWSYHAVNVLIHLGAALALWGGLRRTLRRPVFLEKVNADADRLALVVAALWALHPLQTQAVTYTVQRAESLMGFFYLFTFYAWARGVQAERPKRWLLVAIAACALGMSTKEVMATAPLLVFLYDRTFVAGGFAAAWRARRGYYIGLAATWVVLGGLVLSAGGNRGGTVGLGVGVAWWAYGLTQFQAITRYLVLSVWPQPLVFEYGTFWVRRAGEVLPYATVILPLVVGTIWALKRRPVVGFAGAWFFGILAPTSLAPGTIQMIVEHRMYLPLAAVLSVLVLGFYARWGQRVLVAGVVVAVGFAGLTVRRNHDYRSALALWSVTAEQRPENPRAHEGRAEALTAAGWTDEAIAAHATAVKLQPDEPIYRHNLAQALAVAGRRSEAIEEFQKALFLMPGSARTHGNLAVVLGEMGDTDGAQRHYVEARRLEPANPLWARNAAILLFRIGSRDEALAAYETARRLGPGDAENYFNLAGALEAMGRTPEAITCYAEALRLQPDHFNGHLKIADLLLDARREAEAIPHYEAAVKLRPENAVGHQNLGVAYAQVDRLVEAGAQFETALRLNPDYPAARRNLAQVRALLDTAK
jgi:Flp pilus assembly protein TadD